MSPVSSVRLPVFYSYSLHISIHGAHAWACVCVCVCQARKIHLSKIVSSHFLWEKVDKHDAKPIYLPQEVFTLIIEMKKVSLTVVRAGMLG